MADDYYKAQMAKLGATGHWSLQEQSRAGTRYPGQQCVSVVRHGQVGPVSGCQTTEY